MFHLRRFYDFQKKSEHILQVTQEENALKIPMLGFEGLSPWIPLYKKPESSIDNWALA